MTRVAAWLAAIAGVRYHIQNSAVTKMTGRQWKAGSPPCVITCKTDPRKMREIARLRPTLSIKVARSSMGCTTFLSARRAGTPEVPRGPES